MSDSLEIKDRLKAKFDQEAQKLSPIRNRIIVFRYDENKEFADEVKNLELTCNWDPVKILIVESFFETKYILEHEDKDSHYLVYLPFARPKDWKNNWLIDIELYSAEFRADSLWMSLEECWIDISLYNKLVKYSNFFSNKQRREQLSKVFEYQVMKSMKVEDIELAMILVSSWAKFWWIEDAIINIFEWWLDEEENKKWNLIEKSWLTDAFWRIMREDYWYNLSENPTLLNFWFCLFFAAIRHECPRLKFLDKFKDYRTAVDDAKAYATIKKWIDTSSVAEIYKNICDIVIEKKKITSNSFKDDYENIDELQHLTIVQKFENLVLRFCSEKMWLVDNKKLISVIEYRKQNSPRYSYYSADYEIIKLALELWTYVDNPKFEANSFSEMWNYYINTWYNVDTLYRNFIYQYNLSPHQDHRHYMLESINNKYVSWARWINDRWYKILDDENFTDDWWKSNLKKEWNFWNDYIDPNIWKRKTVVVISDAFRYEAAKELQEDLERVTKWASELTAIQGCIPSYTQLWMASLLPHDRLDYVDQEKDIFNINWISTAWIENRKKILEAVSEKYTAVKWVDFEKQSDEDKRAFMSNYDIVYIYHNIIDEMGENTDPKNLPNVAKECIDDIKKIIKKCTDRLNIYQVYVTADHGFLYQLKDLEAIDKSERNNNALRKSSRFEISRKSEAEKENDLSISLSYLWNDDLVVCTPWSDLRYAKQWAAKQYVHWWATLQEVVVPVLSYHHKKEKVEYNTYAEITLLNPPKLITTNSFYLTVFQTTELKDKLKPGKYKIVVKDVEDPSNVWKEVSEAYEFIADKTTTEPDTRKSKITLSLKSNIPNGNYYIIIAPEWKDKDNNSYSIIYPTKIQTFVQDDWFNF